MRLRPDGRTVDQLRPVSFELDFTRFAPASVLTSFGDTKVLCNVTVQPGVPKFLEGKGQGWLTAEYRMLPGATTQRQPRVYEVVGTHSGNSAANWAEFARIFGYEGVGGADGDRGCGRAASGCRDPHGGDYWGFVALAIAMRKLVERGEVERSAIIQPVAAVSVGLLNGEALLDLNYPEDVAADIDFNVVMTGDLQLIEIQGTAEEGSFSRYQLDQILDMAETGIKQLFTAQRQALGDL